MVKDKEEIIYYLADRYKLSLDVTKRIISYQFKFVTDIMKKGKFETIRLPYFGKFSVNQNRVKYITKLKNEKENKK